MESRDEVHHTFNTSIHTPLLLCSFEVSTTSPSSPVAPCRFDLKLSAAPVPCCCVPLVCMSRDILRGDLGVTWDSIKGLDTAKALLKEAVVLPIKYPQ